MNSFGNFYYNKKINLYKKRYNKILDKFSCSIGKQVYKKNFELRAYKNEKIFFVFLKNFNYKYKLLNNNYLKFFKLKKINYAIDAGVFDGKETFKLLKYLKKNYKFKKLFGFEPNSDLFKSVRFYKIMNKKYFELCQNILSNKNELLKFYIDSSSQSSSFVNNNIQFKKKSEKNIKAITIDSFFKEKQVSLNFIRLDVEGSEMKVLKGAKQQIIKYKPQILISIYHKKEDLLDIPEYLLSLNNNYRFKMLPLSYTFVDTVLFAY
jgi:FkbM family methyltransferase